MAHLSPVRSQRCAWALVDSTGALLAGVNCTSSQISTGNFNMVLTDPLDDLEMDVTVTVASASQGTGQYSPVESTDITKRIKLFAGAAATNRDFYVSFWRIAR